MAGGTALAGRQGRQELGGSQAVNGRGKVFVGARMHKAALEDGGGKRVLADPGR